MLEREDTTTLLREHGLRATPIRCEVLGILQEKEAAVTNQEIEERMNGIDRITLYRTLKNFEAKGLIHKVVDGTDVAKYALCQSSCTEKNHVHQHIHFHCENCTLTYCIDEISFPSFTSPSGYQINSTEVILNGVCKKCLD